MRGVRSVVLKKGRGTPRLHRPPPMPWCRVGSHPSKTSVDMKQAIPWSVKGVDANARDAAKDAARRAGMTLGEWLNTVIAETASEREERERREAAQSHAPAHPQARDFEGEERPAAHAASPSRSRPAAPASRPA